MVCINAGLRTYAADPGRLVVRLQPVGTDGEAAAAGHVLNEFERAGLRNPHIEEFPCHSLRRAECEVAVRNATGVGWPTGSVPGEPIGHLYFFFGK